MGTGGRPSRPPSGAHRHRPLLPRQLCCDDGCVRDDLTGLVLAGGASRRMGHDKALLDVDGRRLVHHVAARLSAVCARVLVAPGARRLPGLPWAQVDDLAPGEGPLAGIIGGLAVASTPLLAVVAVDMPRVDPAVLAVLADAWDGGVAVVPVAAGRPQPLHAVYAVARLPVLTAAFAAGERSVSRALGRTDAVFLDVGDDRWALDLDTPDDLLRFRRS